jgi:hypothetical protein
MYIPDISVFNFLQICKHLDKSKGLKVRLSLFVIIQALSSWLLIIARQPFSSLADLQCHSIVWTHLLVPGFFFILTIFYNVEK